MYIASFFVDHLAVRQCYIRCHPERNLKFSFSPFAPFFYFSSSQKTFFLSLSLPPVRSSISLSAPFHAAHVPNLFLRFLEFSLCLLALQPLSPSSFSTILAFSLPPASLTSQVPISAFPTHLSIISLLSLSLLPSSRSLPSHSLSVFLHPLSAIFIFDLFPVC